MFVDFTSQDTRDNWKEMLKENVLDYGTSSVWNDNCEYDSMVDKDCRCSFEGKGGTIGQLKSVMSNIMCHITDEAIHETFDNTRPYVVCRSGHAGIQRYAQTWAGDNLTCWESLKYNIATILGMGLIRCCKPGLRYRRLLRTCSGSRAVSAMDSERYFPAPFLHPLHEY